METLGAVSLLLAFCLAVYALIGSIVGAAKKRPFLVVSAERAVYCVWLLVTLASGLLVYMLMTSDFRMAYVAARSNKAMPAVYKFSAWWGGQEGSLLLWSWMLACYAAIVVFMNRRKFRDMMPYVIATLMATQVFFLSLNNFLEPPFKVLAVGQGIQPVQDGGGLNPLLQYWTMVIHPPTLYLGYVGFVVPFAFAFASLITRQKGDQWIAATRRWTLVTWLFQSAGILLGAGWAYAVLGWGGYWGWDPVENASLMPWITATAFLHSVMMQEKKGMMKIWNMVLVAATFFLCIFGTFLTRSGIVSSVHAFAQSQLGPWFVGFMSIGIVITTFFILRRLDYLKSEAHLESVISREPSFLFNNLILLASCFAVLWGTMFPVLTEAIINEKVTVGAPFFNKVNVPIGLFLMLLTGVGPLIAWRRSSWESLKKAFRWPAAAMVLLIGALLAAGVRHFYALVCLGLCAFVSTTIGMEFFKGAWAIHLRDKMNVLRAAMELTHRNTRRYGGYVVHMGVVLMFIGFAGAAFNQDTTAEVPAGGVVKLGHYELRIKELKDGMNDNYQWQNASIDAYKDGQYLGELRPEQRAYQAGSGTQPVSVVSIRRRLNEDLYLNFAGMSQQKPGFAIIQAYVFPLVSWIWIGFWVLAFGTLVCLVPSKQKLVYAKTQIVGRYAQQPVITK